MRVSDVDLNTLIIEGIEHTDHPDYCDAYYSYGQLNSGLTMTDEQLERFKDLYPNLFYEMLTNTIY
jgi:hypothetical protein